MEKRAFNFFAGPSGLPLEVLKEAQAELLDFAGTGVSVMEISHRSKEFQNVIDTAEDDLLKILGLSKDEYGVVFLASGATHQFVMLGMNALKDGGKADYVVSGKWAQRAWEEASFWGDAKVVATSENREDKYAELPEIKKENMRDDAKYLHFTSNNTIYGTQFWDMPEAKEGVALICDMSSDFLSRDFDATKFDMIYAGAQKNIGPSGVTVAIIKRSFAEKVFTSKVPKPLDYKFQMKKGSMFNTPPCFNIYMVGKVLKWILKNGGLKGIEAINREKSNILYGKIDEHPEFFKGYVKNKHHRSWMNVCFNLPTEELEKQFIEEAKAKRMLGLKGYRDLGGIRASIYNSVTVDDVKVLTHFMEEFYLRNR